MKSKAHASDWFSREIRNKRISMGLSLKRAAQDLGLGHISLFRYEHNTDPSLLIGLRLCRYYGIDPNMIPELEGRASRSLGMRPRTRKEEVLSNPDLADE